jgi:hypothetical protein
MGWPSSSGTVDILSTTRGAFDWKRSHRYSIFIDVTGSTERVLEFTASSAKQRVAMGDALRLAAGASAAFRIRVQAAVGGNVEAIEDGGTIRSLQDAKVTQPDQRPRSSLVSIKVRDNHGKLWLVGNPIYINFD